MSNPLNILQTLDRNLDHRIELIVYGRAAIALGFPSSPHGADATLDVDGIIPSSQAEQIGRDFAFWDALEKTNAQLEGDKLYLTHLFDEAQVILTPDWQERRVRIEELQLEHIAVSRPSTIDLVLTKMMRGNDPTDMADIRFLIGQERILPAKTSCKRFQPR